MNCINPAKKGDRIDWMARVISRSMGKEGVVSTRNVRKANATMAETSAAWNSKVLYHCAGGDEVSAFAARCSVSFISSTGFSPASSGILLFLLPQDKAFRKGDDHVHESLSPFCYCNDSRYSKTVCASSPPACACAIRGIPCGPGILIASGYALSAAITISR